MSEKRYYWLKLNEHFFDRKVIKYLRTLPNGHAIIVIYLELLCISLCNDGYVYIDGFYPSMEEEIALLLGEDVMTVKLALAALEASQMITKGGNEADFYMKEYPEMVGSEVASAKRVRALRARKKQESVTLKRLGNAGVTDGNGLVTACNTDKDIDKEKDKESDKEIMAPPVPFGIYGNVYLTVPELESLKERFPDSYKGRIDKLSAYLKTTGRKYRSHYLTMIRWDEMNNKERRLRSGSRSRIWTKSSACQMIRSGSAVNTGSMKERRCTRGCASKK